MRKMTFALVMLATCTLGCASTMDQPERAATTTIENDEPRAAQPMTRSERLRQQPLDWDVTRGEVSADDTRADTLPDDAGPARSEDGGAPDPDADARARELYPDQWEGLERAGTRAGANFGTQDVFTQYCENCAGTNLNYPQRAIGKLFTGKGSCSASVISGSNVVVTAAHCCYDRGAGDWIRGWSFAPAYRDGFAPFGTFDWSSAAILNSWISAGDRRSDVCAIKLRPDTSGRNVTYYTGWLGRSWNFGTTQVHHSVGYPGNIGGGNKMELCVSESFNPSGSCGGAAVLNTGCSMTYGSSGGPWVRHYRDGNWVNSVVSGYDNGTCTGSFGSTFNGPRFTSSNIVPVCNAVGC